MFVKILKPFLRLCCRVLRFLSPRPWFRSGPVVAILPLNGVIGQGGRMRGEGLTLDSLESQIEKAFKQPRAKAVVLSINSPGGSPVQSALIANRIREEAAKKKLPVLSFIQDVGASGGYWLACAGDEIIAMEASIVGSIGVVAAGFGFTEFIEKHGIERRVYTQGKNKAMLDPFLPEKPDDVKQLKSAQKDVHDVFIDWVKRNRGDKLTAADAEIFTGAIWSGIGAKKMGLVDELGDIRSICRQRFGDKVVFKIFKEPKGFFSRKFGVFHAQYWVDAIADAVSERTLWARFGL